jgi:hypothetical protein
MPTKLSAVFAAVTAAAALTRPAPAPAQDMINNLPDYTSAWVMGDLMQRRGRDFEAEASHRPQPKSRKATPAPAARPQTDAAGLLRRAAYQPSPRVQSKLEAAFAAYLAGRPTGAAAPALLRALSADSPPGSPFSRLLAPQMSGELQGDYARWLSSTGHSERNLFDVHTAFLMHAWAIANGGVMIADNRTAFDAIRDDLVALQLRSDTPALLVRSDAAKQEEAQSFALFTALLVSAWSHADAQDRIVLRRGVAALGRRIGVDFTKVRLTSSGFSSRPG